VLIGQEDELAIAVASALPLAFAILQVDARENAAVEAVGVSVVNDKVVEVGLQPVRGPALCGGPSAGAIGGCMRERETPNATAVADTHQDVAFRGQVRLH